MKKPTVIRTVLAATLLMAATGCQDKEVLIDTEFEEVKVGHQKQEVVINFATFADRTTRAVATLSDLEFYHQTFKVYGTKTNNDGQKIQPIFEGVVVTANVADDADTPNTWEYETDRYWDKQADNYQFVAFAPAHAPLGYQHNLVEVNDPTAKFFSTENLTLIGQNLQEGNPLGTEKNTGFTGEEGADCDVMRSAPFAVTDPATTPVVTLNFRHTLAKLLLTVKANAAAPYTITVTGVSVENLLSTGTYDHTEGWEAEGTDLVNYRYTTPATALSAIGKTYFIESLVMPQAVAATQGVTIHYTVTTGNYSEQFTYVTTLADIFGDKATYFIAGNSYTANFNIAPEKNIITFDAGVTAWTENSSDTELN